MNRNRILTIVFGLVSAVALIAGTAVAAQASTVVKTAPDITCNSGYEIISNYYAGEGGGAGLTGNGHSLPISYKAPAGSCWRPIDRYTDPLGTYGYQYQNEGGQCMWNNGGVVELNNCVPGDNLEQYYGYQYESGQGGWYVATQNPANQAWELNPCALNNAVFFSYIGNACEIWHF